MIITQVFRLQPNKKQHQALNEILESQRQLYNAALEERIDCYRKTGKSISKFDQYKSLTELRQDKDFSTLPVTLQRATLKRLSNAFTGFFRRLKRNERAGFPRFRSRKTFKSFGMTAPPVLKKNRIYLIKGMPGALRVHLHRPIQGPIKTCYFKNDSKGWVIGLQIEVEAALARQGEDIGIDVGLMSLAMLSNGEPVPNLRHLRRIERKLKVRQRALARCQRGSRRRKKVKCEVTRLHAKTANTRATYLHQVSANLTKRYSTIYVEELNIRKMIPGYLANVDPGISVLFKLRHYQNIVAFPE